jgi:predicted nucleic acid-binding Zn ribbon protein
MSRITCPHCGAFVDSGRSVCPNCRAVLQKKSSLTPYLIVAAIIGVIILVVAVILLLPGPPPTPLPNPQLKVPPTVAGEAALQAPSCTIAITPSKVPPASIRLQVMTSTCSAGDITELRVSVNGAQKGTLSPNPGSSGTFAGTSGSNNVIVTAKYANGAESVVFQNTAL